MEDLLYFVWQQRIFTKLHYGFGQEVEILDPGLRNFESGPDFFNAKLKIGGTVWAGNVEMHVRASDWYRHHHEKDPAYNSVILHVVMSDDGRVKRADGQTLLQVTLPVPETLIQKYRQLITSGAECCSAITCAQHMHKLPRVIITDWKTALASERLAQKVQRVRDLVDNRHDSWQEGFYVILARAFGTGTNSDACERLARSLPYSYLLKHIDNPIQIQALMLGQAGFFEDSNKHADSRRDSLALEYDFLSAKFKLSPLPITAWKFGGVRPQAAPPFRVATLAALLSARPNLFSDIIEAQSIEQISELLSVPIAKGCSASERPFAMGRSTIQSLIINAVVPILTAYGQWSGNEEVEQRAINFLEELPAERNRYVEFCEFAGLTADNAFDTQALLQLYRNYCERHQCMRCRFGHWLMRH